MKKCFWVCTHNCGIILIVLHNNLATLILPWTQCLPDDATLLGVTLSSDKMNISVMTGDRVAHSVLLSLANIRMDVRMKSSSHAFVLIALLPCPKFPIKNNAIHGALESRAVHLSLDIITHPLKLATRAGRMMAAPLSHSRFCFSALASYIIDTPKAATVACHRVHRRVFWVRKPY